MLIDTIQTDLKNAQLDKNELKVSTLRLLLSEIKYAEIKKNEEDQTLSDDETIIVVQKEVKKRKEAADGFRQGGREETAQKEEAEAEILAKYLPKQLTDEELNSIIDEAIIKTGALGRSDMGRVIGFVMGQVRGSVDGARVSNLLQKKWST